MRTQQSRLCFFALLLVSSPCAWCQTPSPSPRGQQLHDSRSEEALSATDQQAPFDKLELFAMFAAGPIASYASQVIQGRRCDFTPDPAFLAAFPTPGFQAILRNIKPRASRKVSPNRDAAYELLRQALEATHRRQFSISDQDYLASTGSGSRFGDAAPSLRGKFPGHARRCSSRA
jgi:hypothetical protein